MISAAVEIVFPVRSEDQDFLIGTDVGIRLGVAAVDLRAKFLRLLVFSVR